MRYMYHYLEVSTRPAAQRRTVLREDIGHLNERGIDARVAEVMAQFPKERFLVETVQTSQERVLVPHPGAPSPCEGTHGAGPGNTN